MFAEKILEINQSSGFTVDLCKSNDIYCNDVSIKWNGPGKYAVFIEIVPCGRGCCEVERASAIHINAYKDNLLELIAKIDKELDSLG